MKTITFIGRIHPQKGLIYLLIAWKKIRKAYPDFSLQIIGGYDNDYGNKLMAKSNNPQVKWLGFVSDRKQIAEYLMNSYCIVLPSLFEGSPLTLFEGLASKRPVICSDLPAIKSICSEEEAIFFKAGDADDLASKMSWAIDNPDKAKVIGSEGRQVAERYNWDEIAKRTVEVYLK